jgi:hypothetical protein
MPKEIVLITGCKDYGLDVRLDARSNVESLPLPLDGPVQRACARTGDRSGRKKEVVFSFESPIQLTVECCVVAESEIALHVKIAISILTVEVTAWRGKPNICLKLPLGVVKLIFLCEASSGCCY